MIHIYHILIHPQTSHRHTKFIISWSCSFNHPIYNLYTIFVFKKFRFPPACFGGHIELERTSSSLQRFRSVNCIIKSNTFDSFGFSLVLEKRLNRKDFELSTAVVLFLSHIGGMEEPSRCLSYSSNSDGELLFYKKQCLVYNFGR